LRTSSSTPPSERPQHKRQTWRPRANHPEPLSVGATPRTAVPLPEGRRFAFTIVDDTDDATLANIRPVYDLLAEQGLRITKTVWPLPCPEGSRIYFAAETLEENPAYLRYVQQLEGMGFEVAFHGATMEPSRRERTERALAFLERHFERLPSLYCNHGQNLENLYWGRQRFATPLYRHPLHLLERIRKRPDYTGDDPASPYFWGDLARERFRYLRSFTFSELNLLRVSRHPLYRLRSTPYASRWFITADAPDIHAFRRLVTPEALDRLETEGGVCILSTHLGKGFARDGKVDAAFESAVYDLAQRNGWYVPTSTLLDHLERQLGTPTLTRRQAFRLESRFLADKLRHRH